MISIDGSALIQIVNFLFLIWVLNMVLYKPIRKVLQQRKEKINGLEQGINSSVAGAYEKEQAIADGLRAARAKGLKAKEVLVHAAQEEEKGIVEKINAKAQADLAEVRSKVAKDVEGVRQKLLKEVDVFAEAICEKILGRVVR